MRVTFRLNPERDSDLIGWLEKLPGDPGRSYAIRKVLRAHLRSDYFLPGAVRQGQTATGPPGEGAGSTGAQPDFEPEPCAGPMVPEGTGGIEVDEVKLEQALAGWAGE